MNYNDYDGRFFRACIPEPVHGRIANYNQWIYRLDFEKNGRKLCVFLDAEEIARLSVDNAWMVVAVRSAKTEKWISACSIKRFKLINNLYDLQ